MNSARTRLLATVVKSAARALDILEVLAAGEPLTFTELLRETRLPKSSLHGLLSELESRSYITRANGGGPYRIGATAFEVGAAYANAFRLTDIVPPVLRSLSNRYGEVSQFAILDKTDVLYLYKEEPRGVSLTLTTRPGTRMPCHLTALGKAILSTFPEMEVRDLLDGASTPLEGLTPRSVQTIGALLAQLRESNDRGWSIDDEESKLGIVCVAAPVLDLSNRAIGGISVTLLRAQHNKRDVEVFGSAVLESARTISHSLGFRDREQRSVPRAVGMMG